MSLDLVACSIKCSLSRLVGRSFHRLADEWNGPPHLEILVCCCTNYHHFLMNRQHNVNVRFEVECLAWDQENIRMAIEISKKNIHAMATNHFVEENFCAHIVFFCSICCRYKEARKKLRHTDDPDHDQSLDGSYKYN